MSQSDKFDVSETHDTIEINFNSTMHNVDRTCDELMGFLYRTFKGMKKHCFDLNLVMREGLTNAVKHGNRLDSAKKVRCLMKIKPAGEIYMEIEDQGDGFDWKNMQKRPFNDYLSDHGRGLVIIHQYCPDHAYNDKGNQLILNKRL